MAASAIVLIIFFVFILMIVAAIAYRSGKKARDEAMTSGILYINYESENSAADDPYVYMGLYDSVKNIQKQEYVKLLVEVVPKKSHK